jgi:hypothetical protein
MRVLGAESRPGQSDRHCSVSFTPFCRPGGRGLTGAKALLLILLHEELAELLVRTSAETGADQHTRQLAAVFAGALRGLSRESTYLRSLALDDLTANWTCDNKGSQVPAVDIAVGFVRWFGVLSGEE